MEIQKSDLQTGRKIANIIVHCTATKPSHDVTAADVDAWHRQRGFDGIGYHFLIRRDGYIETGRDIDRIGAHTKGFNTTSIGVAYAGGLDENGRPADTRTTAQRGALMRLLKWLKELYPEAEIHGHRDFAAKACPCFDATKEYSSL